MAGYKPYPRWVKPHDSWIMHPMNGRDYIPDYLPPKSMSSIQNYHRAHVEMNNLVDDSGGGWSVLVNDEAEEAKVTSPRDPPL